MLAIILSRHSIAALFVAVLFSLQSALFVQVDSAKAVAAATGISRQVSTQEWLGPISAIALSPFFGLACLSGAATYGPDWLQSRSSMLGESSPLNNPLLFWLMLTLTVATSVPRFTKVSKPFALAVEKLEMYSAVILFISMRFMSASSLPVELGTAHVDGLVMTAGVATLPIDIFLSLAAVLNIIVVNTIKLAMEICVWLIPIPAVDAMFEIGNKSLCASLMGLYAYNSLLATLLNLCILGVCCLVFFRVRRRLAYMRGLILWPLLGRLLGRPTDTAKFVGFLTKPWNGLPAKSALTVTRDGASSQVRLLYHGWFKNLSFDGSLELSTFKTGIVCDQLTVRIDGVAIEMDLPKGLGQINTPVSATY